LAAVGVGWLGVALEWDASSLTLAIGVWAADMAQIVSYLAVSALKLK